MMRDDADQIKDGVSGRLSPAGRWLTRERRYLLVSAA